MVVDVYLNKNFISFAESSIIVDLTRMEKIIGPTIEPIPQADELELAYSLALDDRVSDKTALAYVWHTFNGVHPKDYHNRSVSMGDVVVMNKSHAYVYALYDWTPIDWIDSWCAV